jgi:hypothetical protein
MTNAPKIKRRASIRAKPALQTTENLPSLPSAQRQYVLQHLLDATPKGLPSIDGWDSITNIGAERN